MEAFRKALRHFHQLPIPNDATNDSIAIVYLHIATIFKQQKKDKLAIFYFSKSLQLLNSSKRSADPEFLAIKVKIHHHLAEIYGNRQKFYFSLEHALKGLQICVGLYGVHSQKTADLFSLFLLAIIFESEYHEKLRDPNSVYFRVFCKKTLQYLPSCNLTEIEFRLLVIDLIESTQSELIENFNKYLILLFENEDLHKLRHSNVDLKSIVINISRGAVPEINVKGVDQIKQHENQQINQIGHLQINQIARWQILQRFFAKHSKVN